MRVFVTGATGTIGSVVVADLLDGGHEVLALARSDASAQALTKRGMAVLRGELDDLESLRTGAASADGVIHLAFNHEDFSAEGFQRAMVQEATCVETFGAALAGTHKPLVIASGTPMMPGQVSTERDTPPPDGPIGARFRNAQAVIALAAPGYAPRWCACRARCMHAVSARALPRCWSMPRVARESLATSAPARSAGLRCTASTRRGCFDSLSSARSRARPSTPSLTKATACYPSPK